MKILIAGSSGFIGKHLSSFLKQQGHDLVLLSRNPQNPQARHWDPEAGQIDASLFDGVDVVVNLCGESVMGRWNQKKMDQIRSSRLVSTEFLCKTLVSQNVMPKLYIGASAIGYYGDRDKEELDESSSSGHGYLAEVCRSWERLPDSLASKGVRVVLARFGVVLGADGGALKHMEKAFRMGMGGVLGSGKQIMSWISIDDVCLALQHVMDHPEISGPVNFVSPESVSNLEFTQILGKVLSRPTVVSVPKFALSMMFGSGAEIFLSSLDVKPKQLLQSGYQFKHSELEESLKKYLLINA